MASVGEILLKSLSISIFSKVSSSDSELGKMGGYIISKRSRSAE
jgi:hypothetical protein